MTNGEFLIDLAERLEESACGDYCDGYESRSQRSLEDADRLREIGARLKQDEKYPEVRP